MTIKAIAEQLTQLLGQRNPLFIETGLEYSTVARKGGFSFEWKK